MEGDGRVSNWKIVLEKLSFTHARSENTNFNVCVSCFQLRHVFYKVCNQSVRLARNTLKYKPNNAVRLSTGT